VNAEHYEMSAVHESVTQHLIDSDDDDGTTMLQQPIDLLKLPLDQQERLRLKELEDWRKQDERLYPGGLRRRRSSTDDVLGASSTTPTPTPVIKVHLLLL